MPVVTMIDSTHVISPAPAGVVVAAFYLRGNGASRGWPKAEVDRARALYSALLPIKVAYNNFGDPEGDADDAVAQCLALGIDHGAIALDIEANRASQAQAAHYPARFTARLHSHGPQWFCLGYTSRSTVAAVAGCDAVWSAGYNGRADLEGYEAHQYADTGGGGQWDWSVIDTDRVPLFGLVHAADVTPVTPANTPTSPLEGDLPARIVMIPEGMPEHDGRHWITNGITATPIATPDDEQWLVDWLGAERDPNGNPLFVRPSQLDAWKSRP